MICAGQMIAINLRKGIWKEVGEEEMAVWMEARIGGRHFKHG